MSIELRHLRYFIAVAEELHFGRAAQRLGIAQPALSQQIQRLEAEIGAELFHRSRRRVELSAAGAAMLAQSRRALADASGAVDSARRAARGETGLLTVGFIESAAGLVLPRAVRSFRERHPRVELVLRELGVDAQLAGLHSGVIDVAIVRPPVEGEQLRVETVLEEGLVVAVADDHLLASRRRVGPRTLAGEPLVLISREVVPGLYDQIVALQPGGRAAEIAQEASSIQAVLALVAAGIGVSLLPASVRSLDRRGVVLVDLRPSPRSEMLVAARRGDRSPLTESFIAAARP